MTSTDFDPTQTNDIYNDCLPEWEANRHFAEMPRKALRDGEYLPEFGKNGTHKEPDSQYAWRKEAAMLMDVAPDLIGMRVEELWRQEPTRKYDDSPYAEHIEAFVRNVDGAGTGIDAFMRKLTRMVHINGVDVLVDKGACPTGVNSRADESATPYAQIFTPMDRYEWSCDFAGRYHWARYSLGAEASVDEGCGAAGDYYLTYTRDLWRLYNCEDKKPTMVEEGPHTMGIVPVVQCYTDVSTHEDLPGVPISLMSRLSPISEYMHNLSSQAQLDLLMSVAFFKAIGVPPDQIPEAIGVGTVVGISSPDGDFGPVNSETATIEEKRKWLELLTLVQLRIGKVLGLAATLEGRAQSGVQVAMEASPLHSELASTAGKLERWEKEIVRLAVSRVKGELVPIEDLQYAVEYNKRYTLQSAMDLIEQATKLLNMNGIDEVPKIAQLYLRKLIDAAIRSGTDEYTEAVEQLNNLKLAGVDPELRDEETSDTDETV